MLCNNVTLPVPVTKLFKACVYSGSLAGIEGSSMERGMDACLL